MDILSGRPTYREIDLAALVHNYHVIQRFVGNSLVMPIVKADAYGHGLVACARALETAGAPYLGVALLEEGIILRAAGITIPIVVLGGILGSQIDLFLRHNLDITASSVMKFEAIEREAQRLGMHARVHLEIDTGIERIGVHYYNAHTLFERAIRSPVCDIVGISSHFATGDDLDTTFTRVQLERFLEAISFFEWHGMPTPLRHIAASGAIVQVSESHLDMVRPGMLLYGISPAPTALPVRPVMSVKSRVVYFKVVKKGAGVSYGLTWRPEHDTRVVTVPIGYGDGYVRALGQGGQVLIRGKRYPIVGKICMDQLMVDIGSDEAFNGEEVVLIGAQGVEQISFDDLAGKLPDQNPREIMTAFTHRLPYKYV